MKVLREHVRLPDEKGKRSSHRYASQLLDNLVKKQPNDLPRALVKSLVARDKNWNRLFARIGIPLDEVLPGYAQLKDGLTMDSVSNIDSAAFLVVPSQLITHDDGPTVLLSLSQRSRLDPSQPGFESQQPQPTGRANEDGEDKDHDQNQDDIEGDGEIDAENQEKLPGIDEHQHSPGTRQNPSSSQARPATPAETHVNDLFLQNGEPSPAPSDAGNQPSEGRPSPHMESDVHERTSENRSLFPARNGYSQTTPVTWLPSHPRSNAEHQPKILVARTPSPTHGKGKRCQDRPSLSAAGNNTNIRDSLGPGACATTPPMTESQGAPASVAILHPSAQPQGAENEGSEPQCGHRRGR